MELSQTLCGKHLGGIARLYLYDATKILSATYNSHLGAYTSVAVEEGEEPMEVVFAEGSASWSEKRRGEDGVERRVAFSLRGVRPQALTTLTRLSERGIVAEVESEEGVKCLVGYSPQAHADYPLRLTSAEIVTGCERGDRPTTHITLTSTDGWFSHEVVG